MNIYIIIYIVFLTSYYSGISSLKVNEIVSKIYNGARPSQYNFTDIHSQASINRHEVAD